MFSDIKEGIEHLRGNGNYFMHAGQRLTNKEAMDILQYALSKGYQSTGDLSYFEIDNILAGTPERIGQPITFEDISEDIPNELRMPLEQNPPPFYEALSMEQKIYSDRGVFFLPEFLPHDLIDAYCKVREPLGDVGWHPGTPYMQVPEIKDLALYPPLVQLLNHLMSEEVALHLNLTGWKSTERNWHQDDYLNPDFIRGWYLATWIALDDIHPDSGPFQYVPGSNKWPLVRRHKVLEYVPQNKHNGSDWVYSSQDFVSKAIEQKIAETGLQVVDYLPKKGDALIWAGTLAHRGSVPRNPNLQRKTLISHYSAISKRKDMPKVAQWGEGGKYFVL